MQADFPVILDACVLAPPRLSDLLFRLAEHPRLYLPKWTESILDEVKRTQVNKLKPPFPEGLANYWRQQVTTSFPEAMINGFEHLILSMANEQEDRHVLAAAVHDKVETIVTFNTKHFKPEHVTQPWNINVQHPQDFLINLYWLNRPVVTGKLTLMAQDKGESIQHTLKQFGKRLPVFADRVLEDMGLKT